VVLLVLKASLAFPEFVASLVVVVLWECLANLAMRSQESVGCQANPVHGDSLERMANLGHGADQEQMHHLVGGGRADHVACQVMLVHQDRMGPRVHVAFQASGGSLAAEGGQGSEAGPAGPVDPASLASVYPRDGSIMHCEVLHVLSASLTGSIVGSRQQQSA
jgi:hypothetical protein